MTLLKIANMNMIHPQNQKRLEAPRIRHNVLIKLRVCQIEAVREQKHMKNNLKTDFFLGNIS